MRVKDKEKRKLQQIDTASSPIPEKINYDNRIKRKNVLALNEKVAAIREYEKNPVYKRIGRMFHCSPDQIKRIVQQKDCILQAWEQRTRRCQDAKTLEMKVVRVSMLGKAVYDWIRRMMYYKDLNISDGLIQKMALQFKSAMGLQNFFPHQEWCEKFRKTYKITHTDSKILKIGYTQGYSVQIKDIMKDVLTECTPEAVEGDVEADDSDDDDDGANTNDYLNDSDTDDESADVDVGSDDGDVKPILLPNILKPTTATAAAFLPTLPGNVLPQLQPRCQVLTLPIKTNGALGTTQKVLVATPIAPIGQARSGVQPMTMTIIPLATLTQAAPQLQLHQLQTPQQLLLQQQQRQQPKQATGSVANEKSTIPIPIVEIKKEIKQEPVDEVYIKQECISEDEDELQQETSQEENHAADEKRNEEEENIEKLMQSINKNDDHKELVANNPSQALNNAESPVSEIVSLSNLRRIIQTRSTTATTKDSLNKVRVRTPTSSVTAAIAAATTDTQPIPPMPTLTRAPTFNQRSNKKRKLNMNTNNNNTNIINKNTNNEEPTMPAITSCTEARKYLKLLEEFALFKENFRLIGLITRADEVLRELDNCQDQDVDID